MTTASTPKGERRRQALVEAAAALLSDGGFDAVRHRAVAERAGLPLASTTYYFESLDALITAAVEFQAQAELTRGRALLAELTELRPGPEVLVEAVLNLLLGSASAHDAESVVSRYERLVGTARRPYLRPLQLNLGVELRTLLLEIFACAGAPIDLPRLEQVIALVDGAVVNALIEVAPDPRAAARGMLLDALADLLGPGAN